MVEKDKNFILVTEYFHPDTAKTGQLMTDLAVGLQKRGLDMTVYTSQPNYHSGENERQPRVTEHEGVLVKRIQAPQVRQSSLPRRLFNWAIFTIWMFFALLMSRTQKEREMIFVSNPPFLPVAMWLVCKIRDWEYTYIAHDLYPDQPIELGHIHKGGFIDWSWSWLNNAAFRGATYVVALGPIMKKRISENVGSHFNEDKVTIIHNWEDEDFIKPKSEKKNWFSEEHNLVEPFSLLYSGNIGEFHDLETLVEAAAMFEDENVRFCIIGEGDNKDTIVNLAENLGIRGETVEFLPYQPWDDLPYSLTSADISVVTVKEGFEGVCVSSKLYTAMAAGTPILGIVQPDDDEAQIIDTFDAGIHVKQGDPQGISETIRTWQENPDIVEEQGSNARTAFEQYFTKESSIDRYYQLLSGESVDQDVTQEAEL